MQKLKRIIEEKFCIDDLAEKSREQHIAKAKRIYCGVLMDTYPHIYTFSHVGKSIGLKHCTAIHHHRNHLDQCSIYPDYEAFTDNIIREWLK